MRSAFLDLLRAGGYILYVRHAEATIGDDQPNLNFQDCRTQRNLTDYGRRQAIYYGEMLRYLQIPISYPVLASPFCRTVETAQLAFGVEAVKIDPFWIGIYKLSGNLYGLERKAVLDYLQSKLERIPEDTANRVIIAHSFPNGVGLGKISNMGTVIVRPLGQGKGYEIVGTLSMEDLASLGRG